MADQANMPTPQPPQAPRPGGEGTFKPNIYPIMYWALAFGVIAGSLLFLMYLLSRYITVIWLPVFLAGLIWGGYRNYQKQKRQWSTATGTPVVSQGMVQEFKQAARDIVEASQNMAAEQQAEDEVASQGRPPAAGEGDQSEFENDEERERPIPR